MLREKLTAIDLATFAERELSAEVVGGVLPDLEIVSAGTVPVVVRQAGAI